MEKFANVLIDWYRSYKRELPWRSTKDPYRIWISEIILQQTRVAQGYAYYLRFVERFPNVEALASASIDEVLKMWQGLGYYSRARNMHEAALSMAGVFPDTYDGVRALKGVGDYTAAAICSIAYGMHYAVVDGNVYRVLARYFGVDIAIDTTEGRKFFAALAQQLLPEQVPGLYNQAIMDFGALQCVPVNPDCFACPLSDSCAAFATGRVGLLPFKKGKVRVRNRFFAYIYVRAGDYIFISKREKEDIWKGLYEFPLIETEKPLGGMKELLENRCWKEWMGEEEVLVNIRQVRKGVKHILSHQVLFTDFYEVVLFPESKAFSGFLKIRAVDLEKYAVPRLIQSLVDSLEKDGDA